MKFEINHILLLALIGSKLSREVFPDEVTKLLDRNRTSDCKK